MLDRVSIESVPHHLVAFDDLGRAKTPHSTGVHFFRHDQKFRGHLEDPAGFANKYEKFKVLLSLDVSIGQGMTRFQRMQRIYDSRTTAVVWQKYGHIVIPTMRWATLDDLEYVCDGVPQSSVIAVGWLGLASDLEKATIFKQGIPELVALLNPAAIMVYGCTQGQAEAMVGSSTQVFGYPTPMRERSLHMKQVNSLKTLDF
jgi:hypothetical protein